MQDAGLITPATLLRADPAPERLAGSWETLYKPGLGQRRRWRWSLPSSPEAPATIYIKRYGRPRWREQWDRLYRQAARHSRAWWEYHQSQRLAASYIAVPAPIGFIEEMTGIFERRSVVMLEAVAGDGFDRVWARLRAADHPITEGLPRHDITRRLARFVSAFHQTGFCHRDLYLCHIFVELSPTAEHPPRFCLIDLARTHRPWLRRTRWIIKDLAQLDSSARQVGARRTDRLRFLLAYLGVQSDSPRLRWYARRVQRKSDWILRRIQRKSGR